MRGAIVGLILGCGIVWAQTDRQRFYSAAWPLPLGDRTITAYVSRDRFVPGALLYTLVDEDGKIVGHSALLTSPVPQPTPNPQPTPTPLPSAPPCDPRWRARLLVSTEVEPQIV